MTTLIRYSAIMVAGLLAAAPAFAQTAQTPQGSSPSTTVPASKAHKQKTQDGNSPTTVGPGSAAYKQKTQGELPTVGPGSKAYYGNTQHSRFQ
jgi:hypothetical protein